MMSQSLKVLFLFFVTFKTSNALYTKSSGVVDLTANNFDNQVKDSDGIWIVEFYAPWCGHCKQLVPHYTKAAQALKGIIGVGAIDCDVHKQLCGQYGVQGFPTIKIFGANKNKPEDFQGGRTAEGIVQAAQKSAQKLVQDRLGGKSSSGSGGKSGGSGGGGCPHTDKAGSGGKSGGSGGGAKGDVVELTESNFKKLVLQSDDMWLVEFFAPWCGHCKNLEPHWKTAAGELKGKVKLGTVDATVYGELAQQYGVRGYPTIKHFPAGVKSGEPQEYDGGRTSDDIVNWCLGKHVENIPAPELVQITKQSDIKDQCEERSLCVVAFLPHILDCQSKCRKNYIKMMTTLADKFKKQGWGWLWTEGATQLKLEDALNVGGFGYPALSVVSAKKMKYSILTGSFSNDGINEFLRDLSYGKGRTSPIKGAQIPKIDTIEAWDGKDGELPVEEEYDLSDVELDDLDKDEL